MKTLLKLALVFVLVFTFANKSNSQACVSAVLNYSGPTNTTQLTSLLNTSSNTLILALDSATEVSLETYMVFINGLPMGFSGTDSNIHRLDSAPNISYTSSLLSAIFGIEVIACTYSTKPTVTDITMAEFNSMTGGGIIFSSEGSFCENCYPPGNPGGSGWAWTGCCSVGGGGCVDFNTIINGQLYYVIASN
jgi:hypothetical protein